MGLILSVGSACTVSHTLLSQYLLKDREEGTSSHIVVNHPAKGLPKLLHLLPGPYILSHASSPGKPLPLVAWKLLSV